MFEWPEQAGATDEKRALYTRHLLRYVTRIDALIGEMIDRQLSASLPKAVARAGIKAYVRAEELAVKYGPAPEHDWPIGAGSQEMSHRIYLQELREDLQQLRDDLKWFCGMTVHSGPTHTCAVTAEDALRYALEVDISQVLSMC